MGRVQVLLVLISMVGAAGYLVLTGPERTFDGPAFWLQLWVLCLGTLSSTALGVLAVRRGQVGMHAPLMTMSFALLMAAPLLRVGYLLFGLAWPHQTQLVTNLASAAALTALAPLAAVVGSRATPVSPRARSALAPLPGRRLEVAGATGFLLGMVALAVGHAAAFDGLDRVTATSIVIEAATLAATATTARAALRRRREVAAEEWRIHTLAALFVALACAASWAVYATAFTTQQAFFGALLTGPSFALIPGLLLVIWRRRVPQVTQEPGPQVAAAQTFMDTGPHTPAPQPS